MRKQYKHGHALRLLTLIYCSLLHRTLRSLRPRPPHRYREIACLTLTLSCSLSCDIYCNTATHISRGLGLLHRPCALGKSILRPTYHVGAHAHALRPSFPLGQARIACAHTTCAVAASSFLAACCAICSQLRLSSPPLLLLVIRSSSTRLQSFPPLLLPPLLLPLLPPLLLPLLLPPLPACSLSACLRSILPCSAWFSILLRSPWGRTCGWPGSARWRRRQTARRTAGRGTRSGTRGRHRRPSPTGCSRGGRGRRARGGPSWRGT